MTRSRRNRRKPQKRELPKLPAIPRPTINWRAMFGVATVIAMIAASLALARELLEVPLRTVDVEGSHERVTELEVLAAAGDALQAGFLALDLEEIRSRVAAIDWVDEVTLQRVWPDKLTISVTEQRAAARWNDSGLLNTRGELFAEDVQEEYRELPRLAGPDGSHRRVAARYLDIRDSMFKADLSLDELRMDATGSFTIEVVGGLSVRIGRDDIDGRIDRFFNVAVPFLGSEITQFSYVDLRYSSGFAARPRSPEPSLTAIASLENSG
jgi:cell division protein FtsQ